MNRRIIATVTATATLAATLAGCQSASDSTSSSNRASNTTTTAADAAPNCTPNYGGITGTGITLADGVVTGNLTLSCDPVPAPDMQLDVSIALFYRPQVGDPTTYLPGPGHSTYQDTYTVTHGCKTGLWYIGETINGTPTHGQTVNITNCAQTIN